MGKKEEEERRVRRKRERERERDGEEEEEDGHAGRIKEGTMASQGRRGRGGSRGGGGGGCLNPINCFAQGNNGNQMTLTPPPNTITYQQQQQQQGHLDDKENSNIQAALDGIRAMKEVLSRNNSHEAVSSEPKVVDKIDQVLSVASQKVAPPTPPSVKSSEGSTFTLNSTPTSLIDMGELVEELEVVQELDQPTDATGVAKSPTSMLARSLWIKEQEQQRKQRQGEGVKALPPFQQPRVLKVASAVALGAAILFKLMR